MFSIGLRQSNPRRTKGGALGNSGERHQSGPLLNNQPRQITLGHSFLYGRGRLLSVAGHHEDKALRGLAAADCLGGDVNP